MIFNMNNNFNNKYNVHIHSKNEFPDKMLHSATPLVLQVYKSVFQPWFTKEVVFVKRRAHKNYK